MKKTSWEETKISAGRDDGMNYEHISNKNHRPTLLHTHTHTHVTDVA